MSAVDVSAVLPSEVEADEDTITSAADEKKGDCTEDVPMRLSDSALIDSDSVVLCSGNGCSAVASALKCPTCVKLKMPDAFFCSKDCFERSWKLHNHKHSDFIEGRRREIGKRTFRAPKFPYTGRLRPSYVTPMRKMPEHVEKPDWANSGIPHQELRVQKTAPHKIPIYSSAEIAGIREASRCGRKVLDMAGHLVKPGTTTEEIDLAVHRMCIAEGIYPSPLNYHSFPKACCTSVNEVVCHGIPDCRQLEEGDIVDIDITVCKNGFHGDLNETFCVGKVEQQYKDLIRATHDSMMHAIKHVKPGVMFRKFGEIIDDYVRAEGYSVVRTYCGHGIGRMFHCAPNVPHYRRNKAIGKTAPGMVFTIEPMINMGTWKDKTWTFDNWTSVTEDGKRSAQFEHTMLVTDTGVEILTARTADSVPLWWQTEEGKEYAAKYDADKLLAKQSAAAAPSAGKSSKKKKAAKSKGKKKRKRRG